MGRFSTFRQEEQTFGPWAKGWYPGKVIETYTTRQKGTVFTTGDYPAGQGKTGRNIRLCIEVTQRPTQAAPFAETRQMNETINYLPEDLTQERMNEVQQYKDDALKLSGLKNIREWPDRSMQRAALTYARLDQLERILGTTLTENGNGGFDTDALVGQPVDVRLGIDGNNYNTVEQIEPAGTKVK